MNILDLTIMTVMVVIVIIFYKLSRKESEEQYAPDKFITNNSDSADEPDQFAEDPSKYIDAILRAKKSHRVNPYFSEVQFHHDYRDTLNAFNLLVPNQKQLFNRSDLPINDIGKPSLTEVKRLITSFVKETNKIIKNHVSNELTLNGWQNNMTEKKFKSGWEKQQEELGLPPSIYTDPAPKAMIKLVKLDHSEKYETDDEIKYVVFLIVQKRGVRDQMVIRVSFVIEKRDLNLDREFFEKSKDTYETAVKIEEIFVMGFMTTNSFGKQTSRDKFYDFGGITDGRMFSQKDIVKVLNEKKRQYENECHE